MNQQSGSTGAGAPLRVATKYTRTAMFFHWVIALLIIVNVAVGWGADLLPLPDDWARPAVDIHKSIGITVLGLAILRLLWRFSHRPPPLPVSFAGWEHRAAHAAHVLLYVLIFAIPLTGWIHDSAWKDAATHPMQYFYLFQWPRIGPIMRLDPATRETVHSTFEAWHAWLGYVLYVLFVLHVGGALKHEWLDRESVLRRMVPWGKGTPPR